MITAWKAALTGWYVVGVLNGLVLWGWCPLLTPVALVYWILLAVSVNQRVLGVPSSSPPGRPWWAIGPGDALGAGLFWCALGYLLGYLGDLASGSLTVIWRVLLGERYT